MFDRNTLQNLLSGTIVDSLIRAGLIFALAAVCYRVFSPFLGLMLWALILAITLYPLHQKLTAKLGGRSGRAATLMTLTGIVLIVFPCAVLMTSLADSVTGFVHDIRNNTLQIPPPHERVIGLPVVGEKIGKVWALAATDLPELIHRAQPKAGELAHWALGAVANTAGGILAFVGSFIIAGVLMAYGQGGHDSSKSIGRRLFGSERGEEYMVLATATVRAVAMGVVGVAVIQAILVGLALLLAGVPFAGVLAAIMLVLGIAQLPALIITLPAIAWVWMGGEHGTVGAVIYSALLLVAGFADGVLKPILLGRGVDAPMPVILLGALGGMVVQGILGMFLGAVLLALGYQIFMGWVAVGADGVPDDDADAQADAQ
ncbi:AI-2E family transporter [Chitinibacteraceae bacterium HSL-7]